MNVNITANTNGKGPNTEEARTVLITEVTFGYQSTTLFPEDPWHGEIRACFDNSGFTHGSWNCPGHGLILGDKLWLKEFKAGMRELGLSIKAVQNLKWGDKDRQGDHYVTLEAGPTFYASWANLQKKLEKKAVDDTFLVNA